MQVLLSSCLLIFIGGALSQGTPGVASGRAKERSTSRSTDHTVLFLFIAGVCVVAGISLIWIICKYGPALLDYFVQEENPPPSPSSPSPSLPTPPSSPLHSLPSPPSSLSPSPRHSPSPSPLPSPPLSPPPTPPSSPSPPYHHHHLPPPPHPLPVEEDEIVPIVGVGFHIMGFPTFLFHAFTFLGWGFFSIVWSVFQYFLPRDDPPPPPLPPPPPPPHHHHLPPPPPPAAAIEDDGIDPIVQVAFPIMIFPFDGEVDPDSPPRCVICLSPYVDGDRVAVIPSCGHRLHEACLAEYLSRGATACPLCRQHMGLGDDMV